MSDMNIEKITQAVCKKHPYLDSDVLIFDKVDEAVSSAFECLTWLLDGNDYWEPSFWENLTGASPDKARELAAKASTFMELVV